MTVVHVSCTKQSASKLFRRPVKQHFAHDKPVSCLSAHGIPDFRSLAGVWNFQARYLRHAVHPAASPGVSATHVSNPWCSHHVVEVTCDCRNQAEPAMVAIQCSVAGQYNQHRFMQVKVLHLMSSIPDITTTTAWWISYSSLMAQSLYWPHHLHTAAFLTDSNDAHDGAGVAAVPAVPLTVQLPLLQLSAAVQAGKLMLHPASGKGPGQVVWVLTKQQLLALATSTSHLTTQPASTSTQAGGTAKSSSLSANSTPPASHPAAAMQLVSPAFMLPCQLDTTTTTTTTTTISSSSSSSGSLDNTTGAVQAGKFGSSEWCLALQPGSSRGSSWQLCLHFCGAPSTLLSTQPAAAAAAAAGLSQAPAGSAAKHQQLQLQLQQQLVVCSGWVAALFGSSAAAGKLTGAGYNVTLQPGADITELPLAVHLAGIDSNSDSSSTTAHASSSSVSSGTTSSSSGGVRGGYDEQGAICVQARLQSSADTAANSSDELHVIVSFSSIKLVSGDSSSSAVQNLPLQQQQQDASSWYSSPSGPALSISSSASTSKQTTELISSADSPTTSSSAVSAAAVDTLSSSSVSSVSIPRSVHGVRHLQAVLLSHSPRLLVIDGFFDAALCKGLMALAKGKLVRSRVASGSETPSRTSWSHFFVKDAAKQSLIMAAEAQVEGLFNCPAVWGPYRPLAKVEALQVVKYHVGEFYHEHYDNRADSPLTRAATIIVYLCDTAAGGATSFPRATTSFRGQQADRALPPQVSVGPGGRGVKVFPVQGRAVVFWSKRPDGLEDPNSIHAADTVEKGEKWIATRWMKDA